MSSRNVFLILVVLLALGAAGPPADLSLEEVLAKFAEARGGKEALDAVRSVSADGKMMFPDGTEFPFHYEWKSPNKIRFENVVQGNTEIQASDGETHWQVSPPDQTDPAPLAPQDLAMLNDGIDYIGPLVDHEKKGHTIELLGKEEIEGTEAYKLRVTKANGLVEYSFLDSEYFLEIKQVELYDTPQGEFELEVTWSDYKEVGGVLFPHSWSRKPAGAPVGLVLMFEAIEVNPDLPDSRFAMPGSGE